MATMYVFKFGDETDKLQRSEELRLLAGQIDIDKLITRRIFKVQTC